MAGEHVEWRASEFAVGDRVTLVGSHSRHGEEGEIVSQPGAAFYGWTVRLDSGSDGQMVGAARLSGGDEHDG